jgi:hypothetical protein
VLTFGTGMTAAWFWYRASMVEMTPFLFGRVEPGTLKASQWISELLTASNDTDRLNKIAALWTASSVAIGVVGNLITSWP